MEKELNPLLQELKGKMEERKIKIPRLANLLGIPKDRIYGWFKTNTNQKVEDRDKIQKWINGDFSNAKLGSGLVSEPVQIAPTAKNEDLAGLMGEFLMLKNQFNYVVEKTDRIEAGIAEILETIKPKKANTPNPKGKKSSS